MGVKQLVLKKHDGIVVADRRLQQTLGILGGAGSYDLEAGEMAEEILKRLGVLAGVAAAGPHRRAQYHRNIALSAGHITDLCRLIEQGVRALGGEVVIHQLDDRAHTTDRRADRHTDKALFGDRRVDHAVGAELLQKALGNGKDIAHDGHIFAHNEHLFVAKHFFMQRFADRLANRDLLAHLATHLSLSLTYISSKTVAGSG